MIEYQCPHCQRVLKVPETFIGVEGACNYCGTRLTIPADVVASNGGTADVTAKAPQDAGSAHTHQTVERLAKELEKERIARLEAEAAREVAEERIRHLERKAAAAIAQWTDHAALQADLDLARAQLTESQQEVVRLGKELETARSLARGEAPPPRVNAIRPPVRTVSRKRQIVSVCILAIAVTVLLAISLWRPSTESLRANLQPAIDLVRDKLAPQQPAPAAPATGSADIAAYYAVTRPGSPDQEVAAPGVNMAVIPLKQDAGASAESLAAPADWIADVTDKEGHLVLKDLPAGRYLVQQVPDAPRTDWKPVDASAASQNTITISGGDTAKLKLRVEDPASTIRGQIVDAETSKPVGKVPIELSGELCGGQPVTLMSSDDGAFSVDLKGLHYGAFKITCTQIPKGYASAIDFEGTREPGVKLEPITIRLSKKPAAHKQQVSRLP